MSISLRICAAFAGFIVINSVALADEPAVSADMIASVADTDVSVNSKGACSGPCTIASPTSLSTPNIALPTGSSALHTPTTTSAYRGGY